MAKKRKTRRFARLRAWRPRKPGFPSILSIASVFGPQVVGNSGQMGTYPAIINATQGKYSEAMWNLAANEVMLFTGYDVGKGKFNLGPMFLNYGFMLAAKGIRRVIGPKKVGPLRVI